jgi:hypothetical protein
MRVRAEIARQGRGRGLAQGRHPSTYPLRRAVVPPRSGSDSSLRSGRRLRPARPSSRPGNPVAVAQCCAPSSAPSLPSSWAGRHLALHTFEFCDRRFVVVRWPRYLPAVSTAAVRQETAMTTRYAEDQHYGSLPINRERSMSGEDRVTGRTHHHARSRAWPGQPGERPTRPSATGCSEQSAGECLGLRPSQGDHRTRWSARHSGWSPIGHTRAGGDQREP